jgi:hypothetical protein
MKVNGRAGAEEKAGPQADLLGEDQCVLLAGLSFAAQPVREPGHLFIDEIFL